MKEIKNYLETHKERFLEELFRIDSDTLSQCQGGAQGGYDKSR